MNLSTVLVLVPRSKEGLEVLGETQHETYTRLLSSLSQSSVPLAAPRMVRQPLKVERVVVPFA